MEGGTRPFDPGFSPGNDGLPADTPTPATPETPRIQPVGDLPAVWASALTSEPPVTDLGVPVDVQVSPVDEPTPESTPAEDKATVTAPTPTVDDSFPPPPVTRERPNPASLPWIVTPPAGVGSEEVGDPTALGPPRPARPWRPMEAPSPRVRPTVGRRPRPRPSQNPVEPPRVDPGEPSPSSTPITPEPHGGQPTRVPPVPNPAPVREAPLSTPSQSPPPDSPSQSTNTIRISDALETESSDWELPPAPEFTQGTGPRPTPGVAPIYQRSLVSFPPPGPGVQPSPINLSAPLTEPLSSALSRPPTNGYAPGQQPYRPTKSLQHPTRKRTVNVRWILTVAGSVVLAIALIGAMITFLPRLGWQKSEHGYTIVSQKAVPADTSWSISLPWFVSDIHERTPNPWSEAVQVYSDPQLTVPLTHVSTSDTFTILGHKVHFSPKASILEANPNYQGKDRSIGITGLWPAGTYYVAQLQGFWGTTLKTPRVHIYTVEPHARSLSNPNFTMRVSEDGVPLFEWEPVEDATEYFILTTMPRPLGDQTTSQMTLIGVVDGEATKWLASSNDMGYHNQRQNSQPASSYNSVFTAYTSDYGVCAPQDDSYQGLEPPAWDDSMLQYPQFTVLAVSEDQETSFAQFHDGRDLIRKTPTKTAINTLTEIQETSKNPILIPEEFPVTMGDCSTSFYPTQARTLVSAPDRSTIALTYGVQGTLLTEMITTEGGASYTEISNLGSSLGLRTLYERGVAEDLTVLDDAQLKIYAQGLTVSTQAPEAPYTWNGSSEMVKYIAANLFAGQAAIDLSQFLDDPQAPLIYDAANEAYLQNPYITDMFPVVGVRGTILYVHYEMTYQERIESAARLKAKVDSIMAAIINPGMNDWQKASAINRYLATNAVYDNAAANWATGKSRTRDEFLENHPNAWDAEGVLLDGKGVCSSYSASFKLLADTAGLTAINITGYTDGDPSLGHAWNKVKLDGRWLIIDPTWNSNVWEQVRGNVETYFAMSDAQANRVEFDAFSIDTLIPSYATG